VNIQIDHMPMRRAISGSSLGKITLNDSRPPTTRAAHAWTSKTVYSQEPLYAGFGLPVLPEARGANVLANLFTSFWLATGLPAAWGWPFSTTLVSACDEPVIDSNLPTVSSRPSSEA
jgi:hypothetical protein